MCSHTRRRVFSCISILALALGLVFCAAFKPEQARAESWTREAEGGFTGGFNQMQLDVSATAVFDDGGGSKLYAGTFNLQGTGCQIWRCDGPDPDDWVQVNVSGFGDPNNIEVTGMTVFSHGGTTYLYAATNNGVGGCEIWRTAGLGGVPYTDWTPVAPSGFAGPNYSAILDNDGVNLYVGTYNPGGCQIWTSKGTPVTPYTDWAPLAMGGFGNPNNVAVSSFRIFASGNGFLHAGTRNSATGLEVWSLTPLGWSRVDAAVGVGGGFGNPNNVEAACMSDLVGILYVGTENGNGGEVWGSAGSMAAPPPPYTNYIDWAPLAVAGFGNPNNTGITSLVPYGGWMFAGTLNPTQGMEVFSAVPGPFPPPVPWPWAPQAQGGLGDPNNIMATRLELLGGNLWLGSMNHFTGCETWVKPGLAGTWAQVNINGFAPNNNGIAECMAEFHGSLLVGASNRTTGCRVFLRDAAGWIQVNQDGFGNDLNSTVSSMAVFSHGGTEYL